MCVVILVDRDPLYAWFVTEALQPVGVPVMWFRTATTAAAFAATCDDHHLLLVDAGTWLADSAPATLKGPPLGAPAILLGWESDRRPPDGFAVEREKPGDAGALCRLVDAASRGGPGGTAPVERSPGGAG